MLTVQEANKHTANSLEFLLTSTSLTAGAIHGFCDAQGIPLDKKHIDAILTYGPTILGMTTITALVGFGVAISTIDKREAIGYAAVGNIGLGIKCSVQTLFGYGLGYAIGKIAK